MSTTIGLGYSAENDDDLFDDLKVLADEFGYGLLRGIEHSESDVKPGLEVAQENQGWECLLFLQSPIDREVALAFGIDEELTAYETTGIRPPFFDFIKKLVILCSKKCKKLGVFFAGEWYEQDRARYSYGTVDDLISLLSMSGHWGIRYITGKGITQDSDEMPFIFNLKLS